MLTGGDRVSTGRHFLDVAHSLPGPEQPFYGKSIAPFRRQTTSVARLTMLHFLAPRCFIRLDTAVQRWKKSRGFTEEYAVYQPLRVEA